MPRWSPAHGLTWIRQNCVRISEADAPAMHRELAAAREALGVRRRVDIYLTREKDINAWAFMPEGDEPAIVRLSVDGAKRWRGAVLRAVLGHELGHIVAHVDGVAPCSSRVLKRAMWGAPAELSMRVTLAREVTADRFSLLAARDLDAIATALMVGALNASARDIPVRPESYLEQAREVIESHLADGEPMSGLSHPSDAARCYAAWLFSRSRRYAELTGQGPAELGDEELESRTSQLVEGIALVEAGATMVVTPEPRVAPKKKPHAVPKTPRRERSSPAKERALDALQAVDESLREIGGKAGDLLRDGAARLVSRRSARQTTKRAVSPEASDPYEEHLLAQFAELERRMSEDC